MILHEAAIRYAVLRDESSAKILDGAAEDFGLERKRARVRREKWKERRETRESVGNGINICRVEGCKEAPEWRPVLLFPPLDGGRDPIRVETAMLDVCDQHARILGVDSYVENPDVWNLVSHTFRQSGIEPPDPDLAEIEYVKR